MTRPLSAIECYRAAERLMGAPPRTKLRDTDRTTYLPSWAAYRCSDTGISFPALANLTGVVHSSSSARVYMADNQIQPDDREAARRCIREDALRHREGKSGSMPDDLRKRLGRAVTKDARLWRSRKTRLTPEWVRAIRTVSVGNCVLARLTGIPQSQISMVRSRKIWGWVDDVQDDGIVQG